MRNDQNQPANCGDITGKRCGRTDNGHWTTKMAYHPMSSLGDFGPGELKIRMSATILPSTSKVNKTNDHYT